jgi:hypothetical protein
MNFWIFFVPDDFASGFDICFEICGHIAYAHVPPYVLCLFLTLHLLVLEKQISGIQPIMIEDLVIYWLVTHTFTI